MSAGMFPNGFSLKNGNLFKSTLRAALPSSFYERGSRLKHAIRRRGQSLRLAARLGLPDILFHFGHAPGDDLLCTVVLREWHARHNSKIWMMSNHPGLFEGSPDVTTVVPVDEAYQRFVHHWKRTYCHLEYSAYDTERDISPPPCRHIIAELCLQAGIRGQITLKPLLHLKEEEIKRAAWAGGMIAIQSSGLAAKFPMRNKQWFPERFQEIVRGLAGRHRFVQIGAATDPALEGALDWRGKTNIRETAGILAHCRLYIGNAGFLMHLARSVDCPSVIIYGGREAPWQTGYPCNTNLYSPLPCAPCWFWNRCDFDRACMDKITSQDAIQAIEATLRQPRGPLRVDTLEL